MSLIKCRRIHIFRRFSIWFSSVKHLYSTFMMWLWCVGMRFKCGCKRCRDHTIIRNMYVYFIICTKTYFLLHFNLFFFLHSSIITAYFYFSNVVLANGIVQCLFDDSDSELLAYSSSVIRFVYAFISFYGILFDLVDFVLF